MARNSQMDFLLLSVIFCACIAGINSQFSCRPFERATDNLREVVIAACTVYQQMVNQAVFCPNNFRNCSEIWEAFFDVFAYQPLCNVSEIKMERYLSLTYHPVPKDKAMFWENVYPFVLQFTSRGKRYTALSDTLTGYIGNGPQWCSREAEPGIAQPGTLCPGFDATPDCPQSAQRAFWTAASRDYGARASGEVSIMLNATHTPIFAPDTYFAVVELPSMKPGVVTKATVLLVNEAPVKGQTKCDDKTLDSLKELLSQKSIAYECVENRKDVVRVFCTEYPESSMCNFYEDSTSGTVQSQTSIPIVFSIQLIILILFFLRE